MPSDLENCTDHLKRFYSEDRMPLIKSKPEFYRGLFKRLAVNVMKNYPEISKEEKFIREITRIKGALS